MATNVPIVSEQAKSKVAFSALSKSPSTSTKKAPSKCPCLICNKNIVDASAKSKVQDSVFCEGSCQGWLHRTCAGLFKSMFKVISPPEQNCPFYCLYCTHVRYSDQISNLKSTIEDLSGKLAKLESQSDPINASITNGSPSSADVVRSSKPMSTNATSDPSCTPSPPVKSADSSRKFNIVVYGVIECDNDTNRHARLKHDTNKIALMISIIDSNIPGSYIPDYTRLSRYSENICRPILAKISHTCEVSSIHSQRHKLKGSEFSVKADLSKEERKCDQLLMKQRWDLIQSGIRKESVKIRGSSMYVNNSRFGSVVNGVFIEHNRVDDYLITFSQHYEYTQSIDSNSPQSITPKQLN